MPVKRTPLSAPRPGAAKKSPTTSSSASRLSKPKTTTSRSSPAKAKTKTSTTRSSPSTRTSVTKPKAKTTTTRSTRSPISRSGVKPKPVAKSSTLKAKKAAEAKRKQEAEEAEEAEREYQAQLAANRAQNKLINDRLKAEREEEERKKKAAADREAGFLTPDAKGVRHCPIDFMPKAIEAVRKDGKTPLIIDPSKRVDVYYTYTAVVISCKGIFINNRIHGQPLEDVLDQARRKIVGALKTNNAGLLVLHMENCAADFLDKYNIPSLFPTKALLTPGAMMEEDNWGPMVKSSERQHGFFIPNENFRVVVVSHFELEDYEEFLQNSLPLELLAPIEITPAGE